MTQASPMGTPFLELSPPVVIRGRSGSGIYYLRGIRPNSYDRTQLRSRPRHARVPSRSFGLPARPAPQTLVVNELPAQPIDATLYPRWKDGVYSVIYEESGLSVSSQAHLNKVMGQLNERPRKALGIETPAERFNASVASTG